MSRIVVGIFVGGAGKRMGGVPKGLLAAPGTDETLVERLCRLCHEALPAFRPCLVGQAAAYAKLGLLELRDDPSDVGPIGGLRSLLVHAHTRRAAQVLALACDLPFLDASVLRVLSAPLVGPARVPFVDGRFQPLAASYAPSAALAAVDRTLALGNHTLMRVLQELGPDLERVEGDAVLPALLRDWDTPSDMQR